MDAKQAGDAAFAARNWPEAISQYSKALENSGDTDFEKKCYSNRSAVYCSQKNFSAALLDGEKCVSLDSEWAKGHVRKGDALFGLKRWTDAANAYNRADALASGQGYDAKAQLCVDARANEEERARYAQQQQYAQMGRGMGMTIPQFPQSGALASVYSTSEKSMFILFLMYLLPLSWIPIVGGFVPHYYTLYKGMLISAVVINALHLYCTVGRPQFSQEYLGRALQIQGIHCLFLALILFAAEPYVLASLPLLLNHFVIRLPTLFGYVLPYMTQVKQSMPASLMSSYGPQLDQFVQIMNTPSGQQQLKTAMLTAACTAEVYQGVMLIVNLLLPSRNIMLLYLWWQYVLMRYLMDQSGAMKAALVGLDTQITGLTSHSMCPALVGRGYGMVKNFAISQAEKMRPDAASNAAENGGFMSTLKSRLGSCTVS